MVQTVCSFHDRCVQSTTWWRGWRLGGCAWCGWGTRQRCGGRGNGQEPSKPTAKCKQRVVVMLHSGLTEWDLQLVCSACAHAPTSTCHMRSCEPLACMHACKLITDRLNKPPRCENQVRPALRCFTAEALAERDTAVGREAAAMRARALAGMDALREVVVGAGRRKMHADIL